MRVLVGDEGFFAVLDLLGARAADAGAAGVGVLLADLLDLLAHHRPAGPVAAEQFLEPLPLGALLARLLLDDHDLQLGQAIELHLEDRVRLLAAEREPLDQFLRRVVLALALADDAQHLVERVVDLLEAFEDMQPLLHFLEVELEAAGDDLEAEVEEVTEDGLEVEPLGRADLGIVGRHQAGEVDAEVRLQRRVLVEIRHHQLWVGVALDLEHDAHFLGAFVAHVDQRRELSLAHKVAKLHHQGALVHRVGDGGDDDLLPAPR